ncbi:MAG: carbon-nitrogen hydrolase family protein [Bacteroidales bacterium]|nr:carbon-nitrogen hydrolase family protein [Bacteroidales bacterium]
MKKDTFNHIRLGMAQLLVEGREPERNLERAAKLINEAALQGCQIVLLPETIDFAWTHPAALSESEPIPGKYSDFFCTKARQHQIYICVGLTEKTERGNFNTALLINDRGDIILKYRKINLLEVEHPYYEVGTSLNVVETPFGRIGLNICADNYIEALHIGHTLSRMRAQIILSPSSWTVDYSVTEEDDPYKDKWIKPLSILAKLYNIVVVSTTSVGYIIGGPYEGKKQVGCSLAVNKDGIIAQGQFNEFAGELVVTEFDIPDNQLKGTQFGDFIRKKGYKFDELI